MAEQYRSTRCLAAQRSSWAFWPGWLERPWLRKVDTVPVVIDDALGFSDPDRLDKMGAVFDAVGDRGQVIVLTCQPDRYQGITCAEVIELSA